MSIRDLTLCDSKGYMDKYPGRKPLFLALSLIKRDIVIIHHGCGVISKIFTPSVNLSRIIYSFIRNKGFKDRWQLIGRTDGGRKLKIIFQLKQGNIVRIITGWQIFNASSDLLKKTPMVNLS